MKTLHHHLMLAVIRTMVFIVAMVVGVCVIVGQASAAYQEICGNGVDDLTSGYTTGSCPSGWMDAIYSTGCDKKCSILSCDQDHDGIPTCPNVGVNIGAAVVNGNQSSVNKIVVDTGHTFRSGSLALIPLSGGGTSERRVIATSPTSLYVSGATLSVDDNASITVVAQYDADDTNRRIVPGYQRTCGTDGTQTAQTDGTWSTCAEGDLCEATGSGLCFYIDPVNGSNSYNGRYRTFQGGSNGPWANQLMFTKYNLDGDKPSGHRTPVAGDVYYFFDSADHTATYDTGRLCGSPTKCSKFLTLHSFDGTATAPVTIKGYPGERPVFKPTISTEHQAVIYTEGTDHIKFQNFIIDGDSVTATTSQGGLEMWESTGAEVQDVEVKNLNGNTDNLGGFRLQTMIGADVHHVASRDNEGTTSVGPGDNQIILFRTTGAVRDSLMWNATFASTSTQCFKEKHANNDSILNFERNIGWNCGETSGDPDALGFGGGESLTIRGNLFVNLRRTRFDDLGGPTFFSYVLAENNTWSDTNLTAIIYRPNEGWDTSENPAANICSGVSIGEFIFRRNVITQEDTAVTLELGYYLPDSFYTDLITNGLFTWEDNAVNRTGGPVYDIFTANNSCATACCDQGSLGAQRTFAQFQSDGFETGSDDSTTLTLEQTSSETIAALRGYTETVVSGSPVANGSFLRARLR